MHPEHAIQGQWRVLGGSVLLIPTPPWRAICLMPAPGPLSLGRQKTPLGRVGLGQLAKQTGWKDKAAIHPKHLQSLTTSPRKGWQPESTAPDTIRASIDAQADACAQHLNSSSKHQKQKETPTHKGNLHILHPNRKQLQNPNLKTLAKPATKPNPARNGQKYGTRRKRNKQKEE